MSGTSWRIPGTADPVEADCLFLFLFLFLSFSLPRPWLRRDYAWLIVIAVPTVLAPCIRVAYAVACTGDMSDTRLDCCDCLQMYVMVKSMEMACCCEVLDYDDSVMHVVVWVHW